MKKMWIVGRALEAEGAWDFSGVFDNKVKAIKHAISMKDDGHFVGPALLNERLSEEDTELWPGAFYPQILKKWYDQYPNSADWAIGLSIEERIIAKKEKIYILKAYRSLKMMEAINNGNFTQ